MNTVDKMRIIWNDVIESDVDRLEARVKELEQELSSARFLIHAEQIAREGLDRRLSALTDRFEKYSRHVDRTIDQMWDEQIPGLMDRLNDLEKKA